MAAVANNTTFFCRFLSISRGVRRRIFRHTMRNISKINLVLNSGTARETCTGRTNGPRVRALFLTAAVRTGSAYGLEHGPLLLQVTDDTNTSNNYAMMFSCT